MIRIVELCNGKNVIAQIQILDIEPKICLRSSFLISKIKNGIKLIKYPEYAQENSFLINTTNILTIYEPSQKLLDMYAVQSTQLYVEVENESDGEDAMAILNAFYDNEDDDIEI